MDGLCPLCQRHLSLTFHHLIPRKLHRRSFFRNHFSRQQLHEGVYICRQCHNGIHRAYSEMTLAKQFATLIDLQNDEVIQRHCHWVAKQKISFSRS